MQGGTDAPAFLTGSYARRPRRCQWTREMRMISGILCKMFCGTKILYTHIMTKILLFGHALSSSISLPFKNTNILQHSFVTFAKQILAASRINGRLQYRETSRAGILIVNLQGNNVQVTSLHSASTIAGLRWPQK